MTKHTMLSHFQSSNQVKTSYSYPHVSPKHTYMAPLYQQYLFLQMIAFCTGELTQKMTLAIGRDLDTIVKWSERWQMSFQPNKYSVLRVTRKRKSLQHQYTMIDVALPEVKHHPYLGVELSDDLTWATHIAKITWKANRILNFISRNLYDCPQKVTYKSFVRPNLEYASSPWDPHLKKEVTALEKVQRRTAHFVTTECSRAKSVTNILNAYNGQL